MVTGRSCSTGSSSSRNREGCASSVLQRGHDQRLAGAGRGDVEQPPFFVQTFGENSDRLRRATGAQVDQQLGTQQRASLPQVRPDSFLNAGDAHQIPLESLAGVRGQDLDDLASLTRTSLPTESVISSRLTQS